MDVSNKPMNWESLKMAKKHDKKVYITDIAIDKVPFIQYKGFTDRQNHIMRELAQEVLTVSKDEKELVKSIEKNKAIIARARESRKRYLQKV